MIMEFELTWDNLLQYHRNPPPHQIGRKEDTEIKYQTYLQNLKNKNITISDHIKNSVMTDNPSIIQNDFPYWTNNNIQHYCIWWSDISSISFDISSDDGEKYVCHLVENHFNKQMKPSENFIYFENKKENKSIPDVMHIHLFIKM